MNFKKIFLSFSIILGVAALTYGGTRSFFSDSETSTGNTFTAGSIDLKVDNSSYYNGLFNKDTSWDLTDLGNDTIHKFFNFLDLKPGDYGEDTISLHVNNNDSWLCADVKLTSNDDVTCTEPELADDPSCTTPGVGTGELASQVNFIWWADDGDNVLEEGEAVQTGGPLGALGVGNTATVALADSQTNIFNAQGGPIPGDSTRFVGKAWCFGNITPAALAQDGVGDARTPAGDNNGDQKAGTPEDGGFHCDGAAVINNAAQSDTTTADITFRAIQSRHNTTFLCTPGETNPPPPPPETPLVGSLTIHKIVVGSDANPNSFPLFVDGFSVTNDVATTTHSGSHQVTETPNSDFVTTFSGNCGSTGLVNVPIDGSATCNVTNTLKGGTITVHKIVSDPGELGGQSADQFQMTIDGNNVAQDTQIAVTAGAHTIGEVDAKGDTVTYSGDCDGTNQVTVTPGTDKTCTVTNTIPFGTITVKKTVINDDGGTATSSDFSYFVDGTSVINHVAKSFAPGTYTVSELGVSGYEATFGGDCDANTQEVTIAAGQNKICTITNNDIRPVVHIVKIVDSGSATPTSFLVRVDGVPVPSGGSKSVSANANHTITEDAKVGYHFVNITGDASCPAGLGVNFQLTPGQSITCNVHNALNI